MNVARLEASKSSHNARGFWVITGGFFASKILVGLTDLQIGMTGSPGTDSFGRYWTLGA